jgi:cytoskeleton protein RodZ
MSAGQISDNGGSVAAGDRLSNGARLAEAREKRTLTVETVADELNLDVSIIEAIESDDRENLPAPIFVQGYVRSYARLVELPEEELVASYREQAETPPPLTVTRVTRKLPFFRLPSTRLIRNAILLSLAVILIWLAYPFAERLITSRGDSAEEQESGRLELPPG